MLDENLPSTISYPVSQFNTDTSIAFYLKSATDGVKHHASVLLAQHGNQPTPAYSLRHPDPALPASKNRYAVALYDSYYPEILYGEVLLIPEWTQPTPSKEEVRKNGGVPPPPQPILSTFFTIQLYNPDQQVHVKLKSGSWGSAGSWEFEMPQQSFRKPSNSTIDRSLSDPTSSETTPKVTFRWKREGRFSPDYVCSIIGKSTNPDGSKRKNKEPDIAIALFKNLREITIYESNLARAEMEDPKGLEVVTLLAAIVLREVFHTTLQEAFNVSEQSQDRKQDLSIVTNLSASPPAPRLRTSAEVQGRPHPNPHQQSVAVQSTQQLPLRPISKGASRPNPLPRPPPTDPRSQWELDREAEALKRQVEREEHARRKAERAETKRIKKMLEEEEKQWAEAQRRRQTEVDRETERLRREFEDEQRRIGVPQRPHSALPVPHAARPRPQVRPSQVQYVQAPIQPARLNPGHEAAAKKKKSFWGLRGGGEGVESDRLRKKQSAVF